MTPEQKVRAWGLAAWERFTELSGYGMDAGLDRDAADEHAYKVIAEARAVSAPRLRRKGGA